MLNLNTDPIDYITTFLTIGDIINFSCTCQNYYCNMNRFIYVNVSINNIYLDSDIPAYRCYEEFQEYKTIELADGEFIITCHKEVTFWREPDLDEEGYNNIRGGDTGEYRFVIAITIDRFLMYNTYVFESHPWHENDDYFPLLLHEERKEQFINKTLSDNVKIMKRNDLLSYPQKENLMSYSSIIDM